MPIFHYEAVGAGGEIRTGRVEAAGADAAMRTLRARGLFVSGLRAATGDDGEGAAHAASTEPDHAVPRDKCVDCGRKGQRRGSARRALAAFVKDPHGVLRDPSFWTLMGGNALTGWFAIREHWPAISIVWAFWIQTAIMTVSSYFRIRFAREFMFGSYSLSVNGRNLPNTREGLRLHARGQATLSGILMLLPLPFFIALSGADFAPHGPKGQWGSLLWVAAGFFVHSLVEFIRGQVGTPRCEHIGALAGQPIVRSLAMLFWIFVVFAACGILDLTKSRWYWIPLLVVMALKTATDVLLFVIERFADIELKDTPGDGTKIPDGLHT